MENERHPTLESLGEIESSLIEEFHDPDVREVYTDEFLNTKIATQIKVLREQRGLTQQELAELSGMKQARICVLEDVNYESWTLNILRRIARAFDLRLDIEFKDFGSFFDDYAKFGRRSLERTSFEDDKVFQNSELLIRKRRARFKVIRGTEANPNLQQSLFRPQPVVDDTEKWELGEYQNEATPLSRRTA